MRVGIRQDLHRDGVRADQHRSCCASQVAAATPMPGDDFMQRALFFSHCLPQPVWMITASPGWSVRVCFAALLHVLHGDLVGLRQHVHPFQSRDIDQRAACHEGAHFFNTEFAEASARRNFTDIEAVIQAVAMALMGKAVELVPHLPEFRRDEFLVAAALVRLRIQERVLRMQIKTAGRLQGRRLSAPGRFRFLPRCGQPRAVSTAAGFMWFAALRSSPAPHFEGQRSLSAGGFQL